MSLAGCQINPIDVNFHLQKRFEIFDKNPAEKIQSKNYKGVNLPCLMPIRVKIASGNSKLVGLTLAQKQVCKDPMKQLKVNKKCHQFVFFGSNVVCFDHFQESANRSNYLTCP